MAERDDIFNLIGSAIRLFANVADGIQSGQGGKHYQAGASYGKAAAELVSIVGILSKKSESNKESTALAVPSSAVTFGGYRVTSIWDGSSGPIAFVWDRETGYLMMVAQRQDGRGYNYYFGAGGFRNDRWEGFTKGVNQRMGETQITRLIIEGNALYANIYSVEADEFAEVLYSRR